MDFLLSIPLYWLWLGLTVIFVVAELATTALVSIWFVVGSVAALLASFVTDSFTIQALVFAVVSAVALVATKPLVARLRTRKAAPTGADRNVGRTATVLEAVTPAQPGRVRLDGVDWNATGSQPLAPGQLCTVLQVRGTMLVVAPLPVPQTAAAQQ